MTRLASACLAMGFLLTGCPFALEDDHFIDEGAPDATSTLVDSGAAVPPGPARLPQGPADAGIDKAAPMAKDAAMAKEACPKGETCPGGK